METMFETLIRATLGFTVMLILIRLLGKKQLSQMTFFTYITGIAMGNIAGDMVVHRDVKLLDGISGLVLWAFYTFILEYLSLKSPKIRVVLDDEPSIVIKKGAIMQHTLSSLRLNIDDLTMLLRTNNIFSITEVEYAILEANGQLSVIKKEEKQNVTKKDLNISSIPPKYMSCEIIVDGRLVSKNLEEYNLNEQWVKHQLEQFEIFSISDVFYAELQRDGTLYIDRKRK